MRFIMWKDMKKYLDEKYGDWIQEQREKYATYNRAELRKMEKMCCKYGIPFSYIREHAKYPEPEN